MLLNSRHKSISRFERSLGLLGYGNLTDIDFDIDIGFDFDTDVNIDQFFPIAPSPFHSHTDHHGNR